MLKGNRSISIFLSTLLLCSMLMSPVSAVSVKSSPVVDEIGLFWDWFTLKPYRDWLSDWLDDSIIVDNATPEDWKHAYDKYTDNVQTTLGTTVLDSDGYLYWRPEFSDARFFIVSESPTSSFGSSSTSFDANGFSGSYTFDGLYSRWVGRSTGSGRTITPSARVSLRDAYPIDGYYCSFSGLSLVVTGLDDKGVAFSRSSVEFFPDNPTYEYHAAGGVISSYRYFGEPLAPVIASYFEATLLRPQYRIKPLSGLVDVTTGDWSVDSRVGSFVGDYGIIGDNGTIIKSDTQYIINETNNTYTNPATGETTPITNWTYDYSDRSYTCVTDSGNTTTITYGDEHVTIKEGDTIYNVYYITDGSGSGGDTPGPDHTHSYTSTVTTEATCTTAGVKTFTCSCGDTYTEKIPATGHTWVVKETVNTVYGENGELITQGYIIYRCSVCGEEYKSTDGTAPPSGGGEDGKSIWERLGDLIGSLGEGILGLVEAVVGKILDALTSLIDMINEKLVKVVESVLGVFDVIPSLFGGFLDFLGAVFPFIPEELMNVILLGLAAVIFIGIIKAIRR